MDHKLMNGIYGLQTQKVIISRNSTWYYASESSIILSFFDVILTVHRR